MSIKKSANEPAATLPEFGSQHFRQFQETVFGAKSRPDPHSVQASVFERNLKTIRYAAAIVLLTNIFWLAADLLRGGELNLTSGAAAAALLVQMLFSVYMLVLPRLAADRSGKLVQYSFLAYYICLIVAVAVLAVTKNIQMLAAGTGYALAGIPLSTCYLFILLMAPLPSRRHSLLLGVVFVVMLFVPALLPGHEIYGLAQQIIFRVCVVFGYCYIRNVNMKLADSMQQLSVFSFTDSLTHALNRRALDVYWDSICRNQSATVAGVLFFDIDDFKKYNDCYTHARGNDILEGVCHVTAGVLDGERSFLFRYGGEEFVVLLLDCSDEEILRCGQKVNEAIYDANFARDDGSGFDRITVTVGCAREAVSNCGGKEYIIHADEQLYIGKKEGKNCVVYNGQVHRR